MSNILSKNLDDMYSMTIISYHHLETGRSKESQFYSCCIYKYTRKHTCIHQNLKHKMGAGCRTVMCLLAIFLVRSLYASNVTDRDGRQDRSSVGMYVHYSLFLRDLLTIIYYRERFCYLLFVSCLFFVFKY